MTLKQLYEKRGEAVKTIQDVREAIYKDAEGKALPDPRAMDAAERSKWAAATDDYDRCNEQIQVLERQEMVDRDIAALSIGGDGGRGSGGDDRMPEEQRLIAFQAYFVRKGGGRVTEQQVAALERANFQEDAAGNLVIPLVRNMRNVLPLLNDPESRAFETGTNSEGGITVPTTLIRELEIARLEFGEMLRYIRTLRTTGGNPLTWATMNDTGAEGEWIDEEGAVAADDSTPFSSITLNAYKWSSKAIKISSELLQDSAFDMAQMIGQMIGERWGRAEMARCTTGTGTGQHNGIVTAATTVDSNSASAAHADDPLDLVYGVDPAYRPRGRFVAHSDTILAFRKLKDANNQFLWQPSYQGGEPERLVGYPIVFNNKMASTWEADALTLLFGDLRKYILRQVASMRMYRLNELYRENDQTGFIGFTRSDGELLDAGTHPVKVIKVISGS